MATLFDGDKQFMAMEEKANDLEKYQRNVTFLRLKEVNSCANCVNRNEDDGLCHVLEGFGIEPFSVHVLQRCKHWKKR